MRPSRPSVRLYSVASALSGAAHASQSSLCTQGLRLQISETPTSTSDTALGSALRNRGAFRSSLRSALKVPSCRSPQREHLESTLGSTPKSTPSSASTPPDLGLWLADRISVQTSLDICTSKRLQELHSPNDDQSPNQTNLSESISCQNE